MPCGALPLLPLQSSDVVCLVVAGADAEIAILRLFLADGAKPSVKMSSTGFDKRAAIVAVTALDVVGWVCALACVQRAETCNGAHVAAASCGVSTFVCCRSQLRAQGHAVLCVFALPHLAHQAHS